MKRLLGKVVFVGIIFGAYYLVTSFSQGNDFKEKSVQLMREQGARLLTSLDKVPGCAGHYTLTSITFDKDWFFSKTADGRSIYTDRNNNILDIKWTAEIVDDGRLVIVQPTDRPGLQATVLGMTLTACRGA